MSYRKYLYTLLMNEIFNDGDDEIPLVEIYKYFLQRM